MTDCSRTQHPPPNVISFSLDIKRLAWSARELRRTHRQEYLLPIKDTTESLVSQIGALDAQLRSFESSLIESHILTILRKCTRSGNRLLVYLRKIFTSAHTPKSHASGALIRVKFEWKHVHDLVSELRRLEHSLQGTFGPGQIKPEESPSPTSQAYFYRPFEDLVPIHKGPADSAITSLESSPTGTNSSPLGGGPAQPSFEWVPSIESDPWPKLLSPSSAQQETYQRVCGTLTSEHAVLATRIYQLKHEWTRVFCGQPLPALVLLFAMEPVPSGHFGSPVSFRPVSYQSSLYRLEDHLRVCCSGLPHVQADSTYKPDTRRYPFAGSVEFEVDRLSIADATQMVSHVLASTEVRAKIHESTKLHDYDALDDLANACLLVLKSTDPTQDNIFHRYLMYLAHLLRSATHFPPLKTGSYLDAISSIMQAHQPSPRIPPAHRKKSLYHLTPLAHNRPLDSLHLKPELRLHADIHTFAAEEALHHPSVPLHTDHIHRFAITAHALSSWTHRADADPSLLTYSPTLAQRKATLRQLLRLTPPESTACHGLYNLWAEVTRACNKGVVRDAMDLLAVFLGASERPDLLWVQTLRPMVQAGIGSGLVALREALQGELGDAVAPVLLGECVAEVGVYVEVAAVKGGGRGWGD